MTNITLNSGHATPANIIMRALPAVALAVGTTIWLYAGHATPANIILGDPTVVRPGAGGFPAQFAGLRYRNSAGVTEDLCLVAVVDAPAGLGGSPCIRHPSGTTYAIYLVDTADADRSEVCVRTPTALTKAIRLKT